jgi:hypothetical protein
MHLLRPRGPGPQAEVLSLKDGAEVLITRGRVVEQSLRLGPNQVHAVVMHPDGSFDDCGISENLITTANNGGRDQAAAMLGGQLGFGITSTIATASGATSLTATGTPFVASAYIGAIVVAEESTNAPVHATIISNTTSVLTIDAWRNGDDSAGTTPGATANYHIIAGSAPIRYIALTENASAASASSTSLTGEITSGGCGRALGLYAHTLGAATYTLSKTFSVTSSFPAIHRAGLFPVSTASSALIAFETVLNADANVVNLDSLAVTWTVTLT